MEEDESYWTCGVFSHNSEDPNLQNIPTRTDLGREIREAFVAGYDPIGRLCKLLSADFSQIEMVAVGHLSRDERLLQVFRDRLDSHTITVINCNGIVGEEREKWLRLSTRAKIEDEEGVHLDWAPGEKEEWKKFKYELRLAYKVVGFGILYGQMPAGLQLNIISQGGPFIPLDEVSAISDKWFGNYAGVHRWMEIQWSRVKRFGAVWDMFGRVRLVPEGMSKVPRIMRAGLRKAGNMPVQGSAQGLIKLVMGEMMPIVRHYQSYRDVRCWPLMQIHDELLFELSPNIVDDFQWELLEVMKNCAHLLAPIGAAAGVGDTWGELK